MKSCLEWPFFEERHRHLAGELKEFAEGLSPEHSETESRCKTLVRRLGEAGLLKHCCVLEEGGRFDVQGLALSRDILARHDALADFAFAMQGSGPARFRSLVRVFKEGNICPRHERAKVAAFALSEPQTGSDVGAIAARTA